MYYILEIQKNAVGNYAHLVQSATTRNEAESKFHQVLAAAAISGLPLHSAALLTEDGLILMNGCYRNEASDA